MIVGRQNLFETEPFVSCHAATLASTRGGLAAAFFGGSREGSADVCIWLCRWREGQWTEPARIAAEAEPTWNPVLFQGREGPLRLFYKVGASPSAWWGMTKISDDGGQSWSEGVRLAEGILGPAKNKPVELEGEVIVSPCSVEDAGDLSPSPWYSGGGQGWGFFGGASSGPPPNPAPEYQGRGLRQASWHVYFEISGDGGASWTRTPMVEQPGIPKANQPCILIHSQNVLQAIVRTTVGRLCETWSRDGGATWSALALIDLPNCNSGIDAVTLADGRHLLVYNHSNLEKVRYPLCVAVSLDGRTWEAAVELETEPPGQYSYPAVIQTADGLVHIAYTWKRRTIRHVVIDPGRLELRPISAFVCPPVGSRTHRGEEV